MITTWIFPQSNQLHPIPPRFHRSCSCPYVDGPYCIRSWTCLWSIPLPRLRQQEKSGRTRTPLELAVPRPTSPLSSSWHGPARSPSIRLASESCRLLLFEPTARGSLTQTVLMLETPSLTFNARGIWECVYIVVAGLLGAHCFYSLPSPRISTSANQINTTYHGRSGSDLSDPVSYLVCFARCFD